MYKKKSLMALIVVLLCCFLTFTGGFAVRAETADNNHNVQTCENDISPLWLATLTIVINGGGDGTVSSTVKNDFTLFPSKVTVIVQLYNSSTYCEDYNDMTLVAYNSIDDLNMGSTITVTASTNGYQMYWIGRLRYRENDGDWKEETVGPALYSAQGEFLGYI